MTDYLLATAAIWMTISVMTSLGRIAGLGKVSPNMPGWLDERTSKRRLPFYYIGSLAFALIFAYLLRLTWPVEVSLARGGIFGLLVGLAIYLPQTLQQFATFTYPAKTMLGGAAIGIVQTTAAGLIGAIIL
ncbi:MAG: hypothetical protein ONA90_06915 [candidate division KSB1 bacterium]|nr:hypothetical protein [candidate division KSB1 bacterium]